MNVRRAGVLVLLILRGLAGAAADEAVVVQAVDDNACLPGLVMVGSCGHQDKPQPVLERVIERRADLFVYLGDNIYGDTTDMTVLRSKYETLGAKPEFRKLRREVPVLAIWDDHDYGANDAGAEYPRKAESREIFLDFWRVPADSPRRGRPGIYGSHVFTDGRRRLQLILLDTRSFRSPLARIGRDQRDAGWKNDYRPDPDPARTLLGAEQWAWLEARLREPADARIIATSIQFGHEYNGFESWTNLPSERQRMLDLIVASRAEGVMFVSGDVHWGELSRREEPGLYPLYDLTASGITEEWKNVEPNRHRVGAPVRQNHVGGIAFNWDAQDVPIRFVIVDVAGRTVLEHAIRLTDLRFP